MKIRESGMPALELWESFFDVEPILTRLGVTAACRDLIELGCGYGTFTIPASRRVSGIVRAFDIDESMLAVAGRRAREAGRANIELVHRDFVADGTGLPDGNADYVMLFNILHHERPMEMLREARRNLRAGGSVGIMHWIRDPDTPRGPPMHMRPRPAQCIEWAQEAGLDADDEIIDLPPYHFGLVFRHRHGGSESPAPAIMTD